MPLDVTKGSITTDFAKTVIGGAIAHDIVGTDVDAQSATQSKPWRYELSAEMGAGGDLTFLTTTIACLQATVVEACYYICAAAAINNASLKSQMYIDGVAQGESVFWTFLNTLISLYYDTGNQAVASGNRTVYLNVHNYGVAQRGNWAGGIFAAACKVV